MKNNFELPKGYNEYLSVDFNTKKYLISFNIFVVVVTLTIFSVFKIDQCPLFSIRSGIVLIIGMFTMIIIHELIHGLFIHIFSKKRATYKISFFYASAGASDRYFDKIEYITIALAPVIILSIIYILLMNILSIEYYNAILFIFAISFGSAIGDFYISVLTLFQPKFIIINDEGEKMHFYTKTP